GLFFKHRETAVLVFVATTLPQFFLVGVSWPREMIPPLLDQIRRVFPSESAIDGFVRINQMGASLAEVHLDWLYLWLLAAAYFALAVAAARWRSEREAVHGGEAWTSRLHSGGGRRADRRGGDLVVRDQGLWRGGATTAGIGPRHRDKDRAGKQRTPGAVRG